MDPSSQTTCGSRSKPGGSQDDAHQLEVNRIGAKRKRFAAKPSSLTPGVNESTQILILHVCRPGCCWGVWGSCFCSIRSASTSHIVSGPWSRHAFLWTMHGPGNVCAHKHSLVHSLAGTMGLSKGLSLLLCEFPFLGQLLKIACALWLVHEGTGYIFAGPLGAPAVTCVGCLLLQA